MKQIPGLDGYYATEAGDIVSVRSGEERTLKQRLRKGYAIVTVAVQTSLGRERHRMPVHRLVLLAYKGQPLEHANHGRHLNGDSTDNRQSNLEWGTPKQNSEDAIRHGTLGPGELARHRRLTAAQVSEIRKRLAQGEPDASLSIEYGVSQYYPTKIAAGIRWSCTAT